MSTEWLLALKVAEVLFTHGADVGWEIVKSWEFKDDPTPEEIEKLRADPPKDPRTFVDGK